MDIFRTQVLSTSTPGGTLDYGSQFGDFYASWNFKTEKIGL